MKTEKTVSELINDEYREYSLYTISNRAIPSYTDGLKTVQRKLLYVADKLTYPAKKTKISGIAGAMASMAHYGHAETSAQAAATGMAQDWCNNVPLLTGHGDFGSKMSHSAAAPRYIFAHISPEFYKYFTDTDICPSNIDPDYPEPSHYLPIIPWGLVNGINGIAVGFATSVLPHDPIDLANACLQYINNGKIKPIAPTFPQFDGSVQNVSGGGWVVRGKITCQKLLYVVTELPYGTDRGRYVEMLDKLQDRDKIVDYDDYCSSSGIKFIIRVNRKQKDDAESSDPCTYFRLQSSFSENLTFTDENGEVIVFNDKYELIKKFCDFRMGFYDKLFSTRIIETEVKLKGLHEKERFCAAVVSGEVSPSKLSRKELESWIHKNITADSSQVSMMVNMPIYKFTVDEIKKLKKLIGEEDSILIYWNTQTKENYYEKQLKDIVCS